MTTPDPITRLNAALEGWYRIERELGEVFDGFGVAADRRAWVHSHGLMRSGQSGVLGIQRIGTVL